MFDGLLERERVSKHRDVRYQIRNISNWVIDMKDICLSVPLLKSKSMIFWMSMHPTILLDLDRKQALMM
jgi:hypothetical protein